MSPILDLQINIFTALGIFSSPSADMSGLISDCGRISRNTSLHRSYVNTFNVLGSFRPLLLIKCTMNWQISSYER